MAAAPGELKPKHRVRNASCEKVCRRPVRFDFNKTVPYSTRLQYKVQTGQPGKHDVIIIQKITIINKVKVMEQ